VLLKATKVEGIYSADPLKEKTAKKFNTISYIDVIRRRLKVIDSTAVSLCMDNNLPILVFNLSKTDNIKRVIMGEKIGTLVK
jgi:uridylate kinase